MTELRPTTVPGSFLTPAFERAEVHDAMRTGVLTCPPETSLRAVARMMAMHHVHCIVVTDVQEPAEDRRPWGIVSDLDLARAAGPDADDVTAASVAATEVVTVTPSTPLRTAAQLMGDHDVTHLLVVDASGRPMGVVSTLDIAGTLAFGRG